MEPMDIKELLYLPNLASLVDKVKEASNDWDSVECLQCLVDSNLVVLIDNHLDYILGGMVIVDLH
jgi:hypothetical protein